MIDRMIQWALRSRLWVVLVTVGIVVAGVYSLSHLPIDAVPDITNVSVMVNTQTGALAPEEIERTVTYPIEAELAGLPGVEDVRSLSKYGLSQIIVVFEEGTDIYFARQLVFERLQSVRSVLPEGMAPELGPVSTGLGEVFMYALTAKQGSTLAGKPEVERLLYLRTVQDRYIKPVLKSVPGVAEVESNGGFQKEIHVNVVPERMENNGIVCHDLVNSLESLGENFGGGYIQEKGTQIIVRTQGRIEDLDQIRSVPVKMNIFGNAIRVKDIADVREGHRLRLGAATLEGEETVLGTVLMRVGANSRDVALNVEAAVKNIYLPPDVVLHTLYTRSFLVNATINTVQRNLLEGGILVVAVLFLILGNIRAALLVALSIPLSMLFAFSGMLQLGISASLMSLGAIDFGLIVDGSVVMVENIIRRLDEAGKSGIQSVADKLALIREAAAEVGKPVVYGVFIIMMVYIPILSLSGIEGKMFRPMALTVIFALSASLLVALFLMPVAARYTLRGAGGGGKEGRFFRYAEYVYRPVLEFSLEHRKTIITPTIVIAFVTFIMFAALGSDFIPKLDEGDMVIGLVRDTSIGIDRSVEVQKQSDRVIAGFKEVEHVFSRMGTPESATDPMGVNFADTFVILKKDKSQWPPVNGRRRTRDELFTAISKALDRAVPGQEISMTQPIEMRFNEILEGSRADITMRIFGPDLNVLYDLVNKGVPIVEKIRGAETVELDPLTALRKSPVLDLRLDYYTINRYGISIQDVNNSFEIAMNGMNVGFLYQEDWRYPIVVRLADQYRQSRDDIGRIPVGFPEGGTVPLARFGTLQLKDQVTTVARSKSKRYAAISINLRDRDTVGFVEDAKRIISQKLAMPQGYFIEWGGQFKNLEAARNRLLVIIPIVLAVIFIILHRVFKSIKQTLLVFNSIPFAVTGGVFFLWLRDIPLSVSAGIGFIALTGIAILDGMVLVNFFNQLREKGVPIKEAVMQGAMTRLRPVIMTSLVAGLGFVPMALNTGLGAEVQRPLATVVIGGVISSTILTLLLLPTLYLWLERDFMRWGTGPEAENE
ncbi:MAG TPA: CusA/CzcA family heavy metal efflux RND transporter [Spirochaetota bacterium]|nr:CusA/CzcA family heavy metal efflux RND transporter [Spirochaetota bacterium]HQP47813.1 CusA/CzcA family heavy metal efflux RND transporter [Spirochaetota bacterium]